jgi:ATP-dependent DNA helicase RecQ
LLRMYGGELYTDLQTIVEQSISKNYMLPINEVIKMLEYLANQNIIIYNKQSNLPYITYNTGRYDAKQLPLKIAQIMFRKNRDLSNASAIINYISNNKICRSRQILSYFNENIDDDCGVCDICLIKKKSDTQSQNEIEKYKNQILYLIQSSPMNSEQIIKTLVPKYEKLFITAIQQLIESEKMKYDKFGNLCIIG